MKQIFSTIKKNITLQHVEISNKNENFSFENITSIKLYFDIIDFVVNDINKTIKK